MMFNKEGKITICAVKAQGSEVTGKAIKPVSRSLLTTCGACTHDWEERNQQSQEVAPCRCLLVICHEERHW